MHISNTCVFEQFSYALILKLITYRLTVDISIIQIKEGKILFH